MGGKELVLTNTKTLSEKKEYVSSIFVERFENSLSTAVKTFSGRDLYGGENGCKQLVGQDFLLNISFRWVIILSDVQTVVNMFSHSALTGPRILPSLPNMSTVVVGKNPTGWVP